MRTLSLTQPHAIIMVGIPGSGKTFFAKQFAETFNAPLVHADSLLKHARDNDTANQLIRHFVEELVKTNQSIVIDAGGETHRERLDFAKFLKKEGYSTLVVWVQTDQDTASSRAAKSGKTKQVVEQTTKRFNAPVESEKPLVISGKHTYATQAKAVLKRLSAPRAEISSHKQPAARRGSIVIQ